MVAYAIQNLFFFFCDLNLTVECVMNMKRKFMLFEIGVFLWKKENQICWGVYGTWCLTQGTARDLIHGVQWEFTILPGEF